AGYRRNGAARRIAADGEALGVGAERSRVVANVPEGRDAIIGWRGEGMLRRQPVIDRDHLAAALVGEPAARGVVRLDFADHEAAAVVVDQRRRWSRRGTAGTIAAKTNLPARSGKSAVGHLTALRRVGLPVLRHLLDRRASHVGWQSD